jgi:hypothetical protein
MYLFDKKKLKHLKKKLILNKIKIIKLYFLLLVEKGKLG